MRQRYLWVFLVCCQLLATILNELFKETFKGQCYKTAALCQSLCSSKAGPVRFCIPIEPQRKTITGFHNCEIFLRISVPFHYHSCSLYSNGFFPWSKYICVYSMCCLSWFFQYKPITWVQEKGKLEMIIWCLPKGRPSWFTIWHSLLLRAEFLYCTDNGGGGHSLQ